MHAIHNCKFMGEVAGFEYEGDAPVMEMHRKALLDDSTSGGLEAVPIEFDAAVILTPLLNGEIFPLVDQRVVSRRRIEATKVGNPTMSWGTSSGTEIPLFDTDSFISAFDNSIYPITGAMELGLDFLADSPLAIGSIVINNYGQTFQKEMDTVLCTGNGTNRPEGIFTTSGVSTVTMSSSAPTVGGYEGLIFGVAKQYLAQAGNPPNSRATFVGTQTSYSRARAIPVDSSADARRIFGMNELDYSLFNFRYAINAAGGNTKIAFVCWNRYRLYRRLGFEVAVVAGTDRGLARANKQGIMVRARFGGAMEDAAAMMKSTDAQA
jgi:HK97 family phage major capsid protein